METTINIQPIANIGREWGEDVKNEDPVDEAVVAPAGTLANTMTTLYPDSHSNIVAGANALIAYMYAAPGPGCRRHVDIVDLAVHMKGKLLPGPFEKIPILATDRSSSSELNHLLHTASFILAHQGDVVWIDWEETYLGALGHPADAIYWQAGVYHLVDFTAAPGTQALARKVTKMGAEGDTIQTAYPSDQFVFEVVPVPSTTLTTSYRLSKQRALPEIERFQFDLLDSLRGRTGPNVWLQPGIDVAKAAKADPRVEALPASAVIALGGGTREDHIALIRRHPAAAAAFQKIFRHTTGRTFTPGFVVPETVGSLPPACPTTRFFQLLCEVGPRHEVVVLTSTGAYLDYNKFLPPGVVTLPEGAYVAAKRLGGDTVALSFSPDCPKPWSDLVTNERPPQEDWVESEHTVESCVDHAMRNEEILAQFAEPSLADLPSNTERAARLVEWGAPAGVAGEATGKIGMKILLEMAATRASQLLSVQSILATDVIVAATRRMRKFDYRVHRSAGGRIITLSHAGGKVTSMTAGHCIALCTGASEWSGSYVHSRLPDGAALSKRLFFHTKDIGHLDKAHWNAGVAYCANVLDSNKVERGDLRCAALHCLANLGHRLKAGLSAAAVRGLTGAAMSLSCDFDAMMSGAQSHVIRTGVEAIIQYRDLIRSLAGRDISQSQDLRELYKKGPLGGVQVMVTPTFLSNGAVSPLGDANRFYQDAFGLNRHKNDLYLQADSWKEVEKLRALSAAFRGGEFNMHWGAAERTVAIWKNAGLPGLRTWVRQPQFWRDEKRYCELLGALEPADAKHVCSLTATMQLTSSKVRRIDWEAVVRKVSSLSTSEMFTTKKAHDCEKKMGTTTYAGVVNLRHALREAGFDEVSGETVAEWARTTVGPISSSLLAATVFSLRDSVKGMEVLVVNKNNREKTRVIAILPRTGRPITTTGDNLGRVLSEHSTYDAVTKKDKFKALSEIQSCAPAASVLMKLIELRIALDASSWGPLKHLIAMFAAIVAMDPPSSVYHLMRDVIEEFITKLVVPGEQTYKAAKEGKWPASYGEVLRLQVIHAYESGGVCLDIGMLNGLLTYLSSFAASPALGGYAEVMDKAFAEVASAVLTNDDGAGSHWTSPEKAFLSATRNCAVLTYMFRLVGVIVNMKKYIINTFRKDLNTRLKYQMGRGKNECDVLPAVRELVPPANTLITGKVMADWVSSMTYGAAATTEGAPEIAAMVASAYAFVDWLKVTRMTSQMLPESGPPPANHPFKPLFMPTLTAAVGPKAFGALVRWRNAGSVGPLAPYAQEVLANALGSLALTCKDLAWVDDADTFGVAVVGASEILMKFMPRSDVSRDAELYELDEDLTVKDVLGTAGTGGLVWSAVSSMKGLQAAAKERPFRADFVSKVIAASLINAERCGYLAVSSTLTPTGMKVQKVEVNRQAFWDYMANPPVPAPVVGKYAHIVSGTATRMGLARYAIRAYEAVTGLTRVAQVVCKWSRPFLGIDSPFAPNNHSKMAALAEPHERPLLLHLSSADRVAGARIGVVADMRWSRYLELGDAAHMIDTFMRPPNVSGIIMPTTLTGLSLASYIAQCTGANLGAGFVAFLGDAVQSAIEFERPGDPVDQVLMGHLAEAAHEAIAAFLVGREPVVTPIMDLQLGAVGAGSAALLGARNKGVTRLYLTSPASARRAVLALAASRARCVVSNLSFKSLSQLSLSAGYRRERVGRAIKRLGNYSVLNQGSWVTVPSYSLVSRTAEGDYSYEILVWVPVRMEVRVIKEFNTGKKYHLGTLVGDAAWRAVSAPDDAVGFSVACYPPVVCAEVEGVNLPMTMFDYSPPSDPTSNLQPMAAFTWEEAQAPAIAIATALLRLMRAHPVVQSAMATLLLFTSACEAVRELAEAFIRELQVRAALVEHRPRKVVEEELLYAREGVIGGLAGEVMSHLYVAGVFESIGAAGMTAGAVLTASRMEHTVKEALALAMRGVAAPAVGGLGEHVVEGPDAEEAIVIATHQEVMDQLSALPVYTYQGVTVPSELPTVVAVRAQAVVAVPEEKFNTGGFFAALADMGDSDWDETDSEGDDDRPGPGGFAWAEDVEALAVPVVDEKLLDAVARAGIIVDEVLDEGEEAMMSRLVGLDGPTAPAPATQSTEDAVRVRLGLKDNSLVGTLSRMVAGNGMAQGLARAKCGGGALAVTPESLAEAHRMGDVGAAIDVLGAAASATALLLAGRQGLASFYRERGRLIHKLFGTATPMVVLARAGVVERYDCVESVRAGYLSRTLPLGAQVIVDTSGPMRMVGARTNLQLRIVTTGAAEAGSVVQGSGPQ